MKKYNINSIQSLRNLPKLGQSLTPSVRVYTDLNQTSGNVATVSNEIVTYGMWTGDLGTLSMHYTSSTQSDSQRRYYVDILQDDPSADLAEVQYSIAYGHQGGSGSSALGTLNDSPSRAVYSQYARLLLNPGDTTFSMENANTNSIYVINFSRARMREALSVGAFEIPLTSISSRPTNATGSAYTLGSTNITLIDDSSITSTSATTGFVNRVFNLVSGSITNGVYNSTSPDYYGLVYPEYGLVVLNGLKLDQKLGGQNFSKTGSNSEANNHFALWRSISGSGALGNSFTAVNKETISSTSYFIRVLNNQYNHTTNPTYASGSKNTIVEPSFWTEPKVYITTVGLYTAKNELVAVAKLSKPILKSRTRETTIRVKLDF